MLSQAPALHRAVLECTQTQDVHISRETQRVLRTYLEDKNIIDHVYKAVISRALSDHSSTSVVAKCVDILKEYLDKYVPSRTTLTHISRLCERLQNDVANNYPGKNAGVRYLHLKAQTFLGPPYDFSLQPTANVGQVLSPIPSSTTQHFSSISPDEEAQPTQPNTVYQRVSITAVLQINTLSCPVEAAPLAAALQGYLPGSATPDHGSTSSLSTQDIISTIVEEDAAVLAAQVQDIVTATMMHHSSSTWTPAGGDESGVDAARMYSPPMYSQQDHLVLEDTEVAGVLGIVCGEGATEGHNVRGPRPRSWKQEESLWQAPTGQQPIGHMCAAILVKLLMDMWMTNPAPASFILASRLLTSTLANPRPDVRCRGFDLLYNLSLHSALLASPDSRDLPDRLDDLERWLRALLYTAVQWLIQAEEACEEVWQSALAVLVQLTTQSGQVIATLASDVPPAVVSALLRKCLHFGWSEELFAHLTELAAFVLLQPAVPHPDTTGGRNSRSVAGRVSTARARADEELQLRVEEFGGVPELLAAFCRCPTHASRCHLLRVLLAAVMPSEVVPEQADALVGLLCSPTCALVLQTTLRLPVRGLSPHLHSALMRAAAGSSAPQSADSADDEAPLSAAYVDGTALLRILMALESAALASGDGAEAAAMDSALQQLPAGSNDPLAAWYLLRKVSSSALASPSSRQLVVLHLHRLIDASIAQHQVASLAQLATVGLLPHPPGASAVLQGAALPQALMAELLAAGPAGVAVVMHLVQRLLASLQHRVMVVARGRDAVAARRHLAAAAAATWGTLVQWLRQLPDAVPHQLLRMVGQEILWLPWVDSVLGNDASSRVSGRLSHSSQRRSSTSADGRSRRTSHADGQAPVATTSSDTNLQFVSTGVCVPRPSDTGDTVSGRSWAEAAPAGQLVRGTGAVSVPALQLLGGFTLVPLIQSMSSVSPTYLQPSRGWHVRLHPPPTSTPTMLWSPWTDDNADMRLALVLLLLVHWQLQPGELAGAAAQQVVRSWLEDGDPRVRYIGGRCLQLQLLATQPEQYWSSLRVLVLQAQRLVQYQLVDNPLLQMSALQEMKLV